VAHALEEATALPGVTGFFDVSCEVAASVRQDGRAGFFVAGELLARVEVWREA
jgi:hypothetical protein